MRKAGFRTEDAWKLLREALARPVVTPSLEVSKDNDFLTIWLNPTTDGEGEGPHINVCKVAGSKAVPAKFA